MPRVSYDFRFATGQPDEHLSSELAVLSSNGWEVVGITRHEDGIACLLRREKDFEVARTLQSAFEEPEKATEAISRLEIPAEELEGP